MTTGKRRMKQVMALAMILLLTFGLTACGGDGAAANDPAAVMKTAQEKLAAVKSVSYEMTMAMNMSMGDEVLETTTTTTIDSFTDPMKLKADITTDMGDMGSMTILMYAGLEGEDMMMYIRADGVNWMKQKILDASALEQYSAQGSMEIYLESMSGFKDAGAEKIGGKDAQRYDGVIAEEYFNEVLANSGALEQMEQYGITEEEAAEIYKDLGSLPASIWIDKESSLPVCYKMDMTEMMSRLMSNMMEKLGAGQEAELSVDKVDITMNLYNFDSVADFEIPAEALNAAAQ